MKRTTRNIFVKLGYMLFLGMFMTLVISAKIMRDQQVVTDLSIRIDHTSGNFFITEDAVISALDEFLPDSGSMLHTKDLKELESKLGNIPQVKHSNVFISNTGQLSIEVIQRSPLFRVIKQSGASYYTDDWGFKFPVSSKYTARVPVATGFIILSYYSVVAGWAIAYFFKSIVGFSGTTAQIQGEFGDLAGSARAGSVTQPDRKNLPVYHQAIPGI